MTPDGSHGKGELIRIFLDLFRVAAAAQAQQQPVQMPLADREIARRRSGPFHRRVNVLIIDPVLAVQFRYEADAFPAAFRAVAFHPHDQGHHGKRRSHQGRKQRSARVEQPDAEHERDEEHHHDAEKERRAVHFFLKYGEQKPVQVSERTAVQQESPVVWF